VNRSTFDAAVRLLAGATSRRVALGALVGGSLLTVEESLAGKHRRKQKRRKQKRRKNRRKARTQICYNGDRCEIAAGADYAGCNFSNSIAFRELDVRGSSLAGANLVLADLSGADLRGVSLKNACLAGATLLDALVDENTVLKGATFCNTIMPDGSMNDAHCSRVSKLRQEPDDDDACVTVMKNAGCHFIIGQKWNCVHGTNLANAQLSGCNLVNAIFGRDSNLQGANLSTAALVGADMRQANLTGANLLGANMTNAWLRGATLTNVVWPDTICPDGTLSADHGDTCCGHLMANQQPHAGC
jgi:uncharacterized protein YjbI with pentapeptide repeats